MTHKQVFEAFQQSGLVSSLKEEPSFSGRNCDVCCGLPGDRYEITGYLNLKEAQTEKKKGDNLYQLSVCPGCYLKLFG